MKFNVTLGDASDFVKYQAQCRHNDQVTLKTYWNRMLSINGKSENQWYLVLQYATNITSIASIVPSIELPNLDKRTPLPKYRIPGPKNGTVFTPTPRGTVLVFGATVGAPIDNPKPEPKPEPKPQKQYTGGINFSLLNLGLDVPVNDSRQRRSRG